jgi:hypothetical protein
MVIEFESPAPHVATSAAAECAVILQRYGIAAEYTSGQARIDIRSLEMSILRIPVAVVRREGRDSFSIATVLQQLIEANLIPSSAIEDEARLLDRLINLGYI